MTGEAAPAAMMRRAAEAMLADSAVTQAVGAWLKDAAQDAEAMLARDTPAGPCCEEPPGCAGHEPGWACDRCGEWLGGGCHCWDRPLELAHAYLCAAGRVTQPAV